MAFNPFNIFRRNQKTIFAVVTVFIMFTFVLSSGLGGGNDFFDWFPRWFGAKTRKGDQLCTIDGSRVYEQDIRQARFQRVMATRFMAMAAQQALKNLQQNLFEQRTKATPQLVSEILSIASQRPQQLPAMVKMMRSNPQTTEADKMFIDSVQASIDMQFSPVVAGLIADVPNRTSRDVIEFLLWEKKADQLGIQFTDEDVDQLVKKELRQPLDDRPIRQALQKDMPGFSTEACRKALKAEFRVRAAQTVLLGPLTERGDRTLAASPTVPTAYDLFSFYRDKTSPTTYEVLAVPAANFADSVPGPSESEARRLFDDRKDFEPDPAKEEPGFREPRKIKVGWVGVSGEEPYYQKQAEEQLSKGPVAAALIAPALSPWGVVSTIPAAASDPVLRKEYEKTVEMHKLAVKHRWDGVTSFVLPLDLLDTSLVQARALATAATGGAGLEAGLRAASNLYGYTVLAEQKARVKSGLPLVLGPIPGPGMFPTAIGGLAAFEAAKPPPLSFETVRPELLKPAIDAKARELAVLDLKKLQDEILKATDGGKAKNKGPAEAVIAEFIKTRGLDDKSTDPDKRRAGESKALASEWTIGDDEGLAPLKKVLDKPTGPNPHGNMAIPFGQKFFYTEGLRGSREPALGTYKPELYPERQATTSPLGKPEPVFLAWRTLEEPAHGVTYEQAKPKVVAAWKRIKARALAKAEAESLAAKIRDYQRPGVKDFYPYLLDLQAQLQEKAKAAGPKAQERVKLFRLDNVAPFQIGMEFSGMSPGGVAQPYRLTPTADIPYPTREMTTTLLAERTKPEKTSFVLADQPKDTYYVFTVAERKEKNADEFKQSVFSGLAQYPLFAQLGLAPPRQAVVSEYNRDAMNKAHDSVLGLLKKEFDYKETDAQKKLLDDKDTKGSSDE